MLSLAYAQFVCGSLLPHQIMLDFWLLVQLMPCLHSHCVFGWWSYVGICAISFQFRGSNSTLEDVYKV